MLKERVLSWGAQSVSEARDIGGVLVVWILRPGGVERVLNWLSAGLNFANFRLIGWLGGND